MIVDAVFGLVEFLSGISGAAVSKEGVSIVVIGVSPHGKVGDRDAVGEEVIVGVAWVAEERGRFDGERGRIGVEIGRGEVEVFMYVDMLIVEG